MTSSQPTQPLTDEELDAAKTRAELTKECQDSHLGAPACRAAIRDSVCANGHMQLRSRAQVDAYRDRDALLAEVDRLRAELSEVNTAIRDTGIMSTGAQGVRDVHLHFGQALQDNRAMRSELDQARKAWQAAEMAWFAGVDLFRQGDVMRAHCAAMRDALRIAHGPDWNPETKGDNYE